MQGQRTIVSWYFQGSMAEYALNTKVGKAFIAPCDYTALTVRLHAEGAPAGTALAANILDDGATIYNNATDALARLEVGATEGESDSLLETGIEAGSVVTLQFTSLGTDTYARGVTVQLELEESNN